MRHETWVLKSLDSELKSHILRSIKPALAIFGLGNPGKEYDHTRHNVGFAALDHLSNVFGEGNWQDKQKFLADIQEARIGVAPVLLVKPKTYMNLSGDCIRKVVDFFTLDPATQILVLSDDIDLPLADLRLRMSGGPGTHNGLKSIVNTLGEDFPRLRIGLGEKPAPQDLSNWVLSRFSKEEKERIEAEFPRLETMLTEFVLEG